MVRSPAGRQRSGDEFIPDKTTMQSARQKAVIGPVLASF
jgi:hypothetical protein